jgi:hypothetical protein
MVFAWKLMMKAGFSVTGVKIGGMRTIHINWRIDSDAKQEDA